MATIKDVARLAGVGLGTASRVISGKGSVAPATAERVRRAIKELEFLPSHAARTLLSGSSQTIGVYIPILKGTFYTPILSIIDMELRANGQHMVVAFGHGLGNARQQATEGIQFLLERGCDGLVVISDALLDEDIEALGPKSKHLVVLNRLYKDIPEQCFSVDHKQGGKLAATSLLDQGHRKFAVITGPSSATDSVARISGFINELTKNGIDASKVIVQEGDYSPESGWTAVGALLASKPKFTALFCANDEMAVGAISRLHEAGISVPETISVMGYDDTSTAEYSAPRLTSVHVPWCEVTQSALNWLLNQCYGGSRPVKRKLQVSMSWRSSVTKV